MSRSEDKREVSKDNDDLRKMKYFCEAINSTEGRKENSKLPLRGVFKDVEAEDAGGRNFSTQSKT